MKPDQLRSHNNCIKLSVTGMFLMALFLSLGLSAQRKQVWIDADTGNETDDMYALARLISESSLDVVGVSSAHFNNADLVVFEKWNQYPTKAINTVMISQQLNVDLLQTMRKLSIPHPLGADRQMGRAWGGREARNSEAVQAIHAAVKNLASNDKLAVICLGAVTNIASAIALDTSIASHIVCYTLGARYNMEKQVWNKSEFNIRNDLNAFDYLLDNVLVKMVMMSIDAALPYRFKRDFLYQTFSDDVPLEKMLKQRWEETNPKDTVRTLWDLALVEAFIKPMFTEMKLVLTPPENTQRKIWMYTKIDAEKMKTDFMEHLQSLR